MSVRPRHKRQAGVPRVRTNPNPRRRERSAQTRIAPGIRHLDKLSVLYDDWMPQGCLYVRVRGRELGVWFFIFVFPAIFVLAGGGLIGAFVRDRIFAAESVYWNRVPGTIERVTMNRGGSRRSAGVQVDYRYSLHGVEYHSSRVAFGFLRKRDIMGRVERYQPGDEVIVLVRPTDPELSVLEPGIHPANPALPLFGAAMIIAGVLAGRVVWKRSIPGRDRYGDGQV